MKMPEVCDENMTLPKGLEPSTTKYTQITN